jgi:hypothetical protein
VRPKSWREAAGIALIVIPPYFIGWWTFALLPAVMWLWRPFEEPSREP